MDYSQAHRRSHQHQHRLIFASLEEHRDTMAGRSLTEGLIERDTLFREPHGCCESTSTSITRCDKSMPEHPQRWVATYGYETLYDMQGKSTLEVHMTYYGSV